MWWYHRSSSPTGPLPTYYPANFEFNMKLVWQRESLTMYHFCDCFFLFLFSPSTLLASSEALQAGFEALPAGSEALLPGSEALPAGY